MTPSISSADACCMPTMCWGFIREQTIYFLVGVGKESYNQQQKQSNIGVVSAVKKSKVKLGR